jgi:hypothetical protein
MEAAADCPEMLVTSCETTWNNILEDRSFQIVSFHEIVKKFPVFSVLKTFSCISVFFPVCPFMYVFCLIDKEVRRMMSKRPTNALLFQCIGALYTHTCFGISKCHHQGVRYEHAEIVPTVVKSRASRMGAVYCDRRRNGQDVTSWPLHIVTDGVMVGM